MKLLATTATAILLATSAYAERVTAHVEDVFTQVAESVPYTENECVNVEVPVYGQRTRQGGSAGEGALLGMIIGGALGDAASGGKGDATAAGAVIGGIIGADRASRPRTEQVVTGYRTERQCTEVTRYRAQNRTVYSHSVLTFTVDGQTYETTFVK
jgi:uncharacterized protein YcfJ